jgi:hypothetical protein
MKTFFIACILLPSIFFIPSDIKARPIFVNTGGETIRIPLCSYFTFISFTCACVFFTYTMKLCFIIIIFSNWIRKMLLGWIFMIFSVLDLNERNNKRFSGNPSCFYLIIINLVIHFSNILTFSNLCWLDIYYWSY